MARLLVLAASLLLAACATSEAPRPAAHPAPNPHQKIGAPYTIKGITYVPREDPGYDRTGIASWYGPNFHGKLTANGELFDQDRLTAAHKTLPLPSMVRVTNVENGRSAVLRVNDRGPFAGDRIIDLSRGAAERLGTRTAGLGTVRVEYLGPAPMSEAVVALGRRQRPWSAPDGPRLASVTARPAPSVVASDVRIVREAAAPDLSERPVLDALPPPPAAPILVRTEETAPSGATPVAVPRPSPKPVAPETEAEEPRYLVQVAAFGSAENAATASGLLPDAVPIDIAMTETAGGPLHRLRIGPYPHAFLAEEALRVAREAGFPDARVVTE